MTRKDKTLVREARINNSRRIDDEDVFYDDDPR